MLGIDRKNIHTVTMPCFGTTKRTKSNAQLLAEAYGVSFEDINITKAVRQHFADINHDESVTNITYETLRREKEHRFLWIFQTNITVLLSAQATFLSLLSVGQPQR